MLSLVSEKEPRWRLGSDDDARMTTGQLLLLCDERKALFDFCGGMMFQLVLTSKLKEHLLKQSEVTVHTASMEEMNRIPDYRKTSAVDNVATFHGREVRKVAHARGGHGFVLQLCLAGEDPEGWSRAEIDRYDGWGHDSGRAWRDATKLETEGVKGFRESFGQKAFTLHHRFFFHLDRHNQLWLSAEDGCEGKLVVTSLVESEAQNRK